MAPRYLRLNLSITVIRCTPPPVLWPLPCISVNHLTFTTVFEPSTREPFGFSPILRSQHLIRSGLIDSVFPKSLRCTHFTASLWHTQHTALHCLLPGLLAELLVLKPWPLTFVNYNSQTCLSPQSFYWLILTLWIISKPFNIAYKTYGRGLQKVHGKGTLCFCFIFHKLFEASSYVYVYTRSEHTIYIF